MGHLHGSWLLHGDASLLPLELTALREFVNAESDCAFNFHETDNIKRSMKWEEFPKYLFFF
jgi:hypothetical protein